MTTKITNPQAKYEVLNLLAPYVKPQEIKEEFGITYTTLNHYTKEYGIPKWQKSYSERRRQNQEDFIANEEYTKEVRIRLAREEIKKYETDTNS